METNDPNTKPEKPRNLRPSEQKLREIESGYRMSVGPSDMHALLNEIDWLRYERDLSRYSRSGDFERYEALAKQRDALQYQAEAQQDRLREVERGRDRIRNAFDQKAQRVDELEEELRTVQADNQKLEGERDSFRYRLKIETESLQKRLDKAEAESIRIGELYANESSLHQQACSRASVVEGERNELREMNRRLERERDQASRQYAEMFRERDKVQARLDRVLQERPERIVQIASDFSEPSQSESRLQEALKLAVNERDRLREAIRLGEAGMRVADDKRPSGDQSCRIRVLNLEKAFAMLITQMGSSSGFNPEELRAALRGEK